MRLVTLVYSNVFQKNHKDLIDDSVESIFDAKMNASFVRKLLFYERTTLITKYLFFIMHLKRLI